LFDPAGDYNDGANWRDSINYGGSPSTAGLAQAPGIVINEVLTHTDPPLYDSIELLQSNCFRHQHRWLVSQRFRRALQKISHPNRHHAERRQLHHFLTRRTISTPPAARTPTTSASTPRTVTTSGSLQANAQSNLVAFVDHVSFGAAQKRRIIRSLAEHQGSLVSNAHAHVWHATNSGPRVGPVIISEFMYQPASGNPTLEFVEIFNPGPATENLTNWKLTGGVDYAFRSNSVLPARPVLLVLPFDPQPSGQRGDAGRVSHPLQPRHEPDFTRRLSGRVVQRRRNPAPPPS
jgi:hypothetical protein